MTRAAPKKTNSPPPAWGPLRYQSDHPMSLAIRPDATVDEVANRLNARLALLDAMLLLTCGDAPAFDLCDEAADSFMWGCSELASECRALYSELFRVASLEPRGAQQ